MTAAGGLFLVFVLFAWIASRLFPLRLKAGDLAAVLLNLPALAAELCSGTAYPNLLIFNRIAELQSLPLLPKYEVPPIAAPAAGEPTAAPTIAPAPAPAAPPAIVPFFPHGEWLAGASAQPQR